MNKETIYCNDFHRNINRLRTKSVRYQGCAAGRSSLIVDEAGEYYPCQNMLSHQDMSVGNVSEGIDNSRLQLSVQKKYHNLQVADNAGLNTYVVGQLRSRATASGSRK